ncbi:hypothetical protein A4W93_23520 [Piscinibacter gummiphilus]|uniref:Lipopolysaccharide biosynthesis protein n=1 Tax=Piscinibacter gummiphilus TaxID=946333 RepID=A0A1W6LEE7_9BURK|nr:hypothetical protein A4W93_23520 [Piscinibacter gummiphilus]
MATANLHDRWARRAPSRGFYDGSDPAVQLSQMAEMKASGLGGVALYHYWFYSHQELPAVESTLLSSPSPLPWFLIWATESWSRRWLGDPSPIVDLTHEPAVAEVDAHCRHLVRCFERPDYFQWNGKPLFVWYNLGHFHRPAEVVDMYRSGFRKLGVDVSFGHFVKNPFEVPHSRLVDLTYVFEPRLYFGSQRAARGSGAKRMFDHLRSVLGNRASTQLLILLDKWQQKGKVYHATDFVKYMGSPERKAFLDSIDGPLQEVLSPGWNNTPRYGERFTALEALDPADFGRLIRQAQGMRDDIPPLINAWNEWSEGAAIEPCAYFGTRYVDALVSLSGPSA